MTQRLWMVLLGSVSVFCLVGIGPAWAVPKYDIDTGSGKGALYAKQDYGDEKYGKYGGGDEYQKQDKYSKYSKNGGYEKYVKKDYEKWPDGNGWGDYGKKYKEQDEKKWGYGYGKDPDCDPPVATPEPATMLLLGSALAAAGLYARRRRP